MGEVTIKTIQNKSMQVTIVPERGMDIQDIYFEGEKISWTPVEGTLRSFENHDFLWEGDWDRGFFAAVASLGPEVFGTPDEKRTVHGTGAYSCADMSSIQASEQQLSARVPIMGYGHKPDYEKEVTYRLCGDLPTLIRKERITNLTDAKIHVDDGYHMQLAGDYMKEGGSYILPVATDQMLLRDSAPKEMNPKDIYPFAEELDPIRCYQYVPNAVDDIRALKCLEGVEEVQKESGPITAELLVNKSLTKAVLVTRPLGVFPRSLLAKRTKPVPMYALEVCKTRPNSIAQNAIDGELMYLEAGESMISWVSISVLTDASEILLAKQLIEARC